MNKAPMTLPQPSDEGSTATVADVRMHVWDIAEQIQDLRQNPGFAHLDDCIVNLFRGQGIDINYRHTDEDDWDENEVAS